MENRNDHYQLPPELTASTVEDVAQELRDLLTAGSQRLDLDGSQVREADAAGVQLLLAVWQTARRDGVSFRLVRSSAGLTEILRLCGVEEMLAEGGE